MIYSFFFFFFLGGNILKNFLTKKGYPANSIKENDANIKKIVDEKDEWVRYKKYEITDISNNKTIAIIYEIDSKGENTTHDYEKDLEILNGTIDNIRVFLVEKFSLQRGPEFVEGILIYELDGNKKFIKIDSNDFPTYETLCGRSQILTPKKKILPALLNAIIIAIPIWIMVICNYPQQNHGKNNNECCRDTINVNIINEKYGLNDFILDIVKDEVKKEIKNYQDSCKKNTQIKKHKP